MPAWLAAPISVGLLVVIGDAAAGKLAGGVRLLWYERLALAWLLGTGIATVAWFLLSPLYHWISPVWIVTGLALALMTSLRHQKMNPGAISRPRLENMTPGVMFDAALMLVLVLQFAAIGMAAVSTTLGWDGLFNFEMKARLAFEHTPFGQLPASYFSEASVGWSHQRYPLLVPFTEFWLYSWLGRIDQSAVKIVFPLFYVSLAALVCGAVRRLADRRSALMTAIALGFVPAITLLPGAASGYAEVPLAASVAGAACFAFVALHTRDPRHANLAAGLLAVAVWTKAEGAILAGAIGLAAIAAGRAIGRRDLSVLLWMPALALLPWSLALAFYGARPAEDFRPFALSALSGAIETFAVVLPLVARELIRPGHWGLVWPTFFASVLLMIAARRSAGEDWFLVAAVLISLSAYTFVYAFSAWPDVGEHVGFSLSRLLVPLAPVALLFIARRVVDDLGIERVEWA